MDSTLEQHKIFPYIAWVVFIGFAIFVGHLAFELYTVTEDLAKDSSRLEIIAQENSTRLDALETELDALTNQ